MRTASFPPYANKEFFQIVSLSFDHDNKVEHFLNNCIVDCVQLTTHQDNLARLQLTMLLCDLHVM
jgi:hypothetical protein